MGVVLFAYSYFYGKMINFLFFEKEWRSLRPLHYAENRQKCPEFRGISKKDESFYPEIPTLSIVYLLRENTIADCNHTKEYAYYYEKKLMLTVFLLKAGYEKRVSGNDKCPFGCEK